jgi:predicted kinase
MKEVIILRGIPGSGKSTLIKELEKQKNKSGIVCSADDFWYYGKEKVIENYKYNFKISFKAHKYCLSKFEKAIGDEESLIFVDNTNINKKDFKKYIDLAIQGGYTVTLHSITGFNPEDSFKLNVHNVPLEVCEKMFNNYSEFNRVDDSSPEEIVHDYAGIRKGVFGTGKF